MPNPSKDNLGVDYDKSGIRGGPTRFLKPPDFGDKQLNRRARVLSVVLLILILFSAFLLIVYSFFNRDVGVGHGLIFSSLIVEMVSLALLNRGRLVLAGRLLVYLLWALLMAFTLTSDGIRGTPIMGQLLLVVLSGLLISEPLAVTIGGLTIAGNYAAMMLETAGLLTFPAQQGSLITHWAIQSGYLLLTLGLMLFVRRNMRSNLDELQTSEQMMREHIFELREAQAQKEQNERDLRRRGAILETLRTAAERLMREESFDEAVQHVLKDLGAATGVDRVYLFENSRSDDNIVSHQRFEWVADGVESQIDNPSMRNFDFAANGFGRWIELLQSNQGVQGYVRDFPASERKVLEAQDILSILVVPIFIGEQLWGFIGFDETNEDRPWAAVEEDALRGAGGILGGAIERSRVEQALYQSEQRYLGILQDQFDLISRYKPDGTLVFGNDAYLRFVGLSRQDMDKANIWEQVQPERIEGLRAKVASLKPDDPVAVTQYHSRRADGEMRWIEWTERGIFRKDGTLAEVQAVGRDIDEEIRLRKQIEESLLKSELLAMTDSLTGLLNRRAIMEHAEAEWQRSLREKRPLSLAMMDVDRLKSINDEHGHLAGDQALSQVAQLIRGSMRRYDWAGRWAGDEFLLVLPGTQQQDALEVAERLRQRVKASQLTLSNGTKVDLLVSLGIAGRVAVDEHDSLQNLLGLADQALYLAKERGRDQVAAVE